MCGDPQTRSNSHYSNDWTGKWPDTSPTLLLVSLHISPILIPLLSTLSNSGITVKKKKTFISSVLSSVLFGLLCKAYSYSRSSEAESYTTFLAFIPKRIQLTFRYQ